MQPVDKLIARLTALLGEPKSEDLATFLEELRSAMEPYGPDVLTEVGNRAREQFKWWPRIAELIDLAKVVRYDIEAPARRAAFERRQRQEAAEREREYQRRAPPDEVAKALQGFREFMASNVTIAEKGTSQPVRRLNAPMMSTLRRSK